MLTSFKLSLGAILILQSSRICLLAVAPQIAIVGGGIGGASVSHYMNDLFDGKLSIDLFEAAELGGRLATIKIDEDEFEAGGSVIHGKNFLMKNFATLLGMERRPSCGDQRFGIWNKEEFVFKESSYTVLTLASLIYRYGLQTFRLHNYINSILEDFGKIYQLQDKGIAFTNVTALLSAMNIEFPKMLQISTKDHLTSLGYSARLIDELIESVLVVNYGQSTEIQSFVGCVSIAGAETDLWSVKGGNKNIPKHLIYRNSRVNVVPSVVKKIVYVSKHNDRPKYEVHYSKNGSSEMMKNIYDIVILATPLTRDQIMSIEFIDFPKNANLEFSGSYQSTIATFVKGDLNRTYFNLGDSIDAILSCDPDKTIISSVGNVVSVEGECSGIWKIFSRNPLEKKVIQDMFTKIEFTKSIVWKAYPRYSGKKYQMDFKLHDSLYHVNAIEWAASAMEMSAIGGRNVAILAYNEYRKRISSRNSDEDKNRKKSKVLHSVEF